MCDHNTCFIVPSDILLELSRRGSSGASKTLKHRKKISKKRKKKARQLFKQLESFERPKSRQGDRLIFDSQTKALRRKKLIVMEGDNKIEDPAAVLVYELTGVVRDYFRSMYNLNSLDGLGMEICSNIHYKRDYANAFWDGEDMYYGDGDRINLKNFGSAIDVVAHELTHGIIMHHAGLKYRSQSGALNEHFCDAFASVIKIRHKGQTAETGDWLIGNDVVMGDFPGIALRSMKEPGTANEMDKQPDHMDNYYEGPDDNYGVHINSGIFNKAFYLSCMALGIEDCEKIWFKAMNQLERKSQFEDAVKALIRSSKKLSKSGQVSDTSTEAIKDSFGEVGLLSLAK